MPGKAAWHTKPEDTFTIAHPILLGRKIGTAVLSDTQIWRHKLVTDFDLFLRCCRCSSRLARWQVTPINVTSNVTVVAHWLGRDVIRCARRCVAGQGRRHLPAAIVSFAAGLRSPVVNLRGGGRGCPQNFQFSKYLDGISLPPKVSKYIQDIPHPHAPTDPREMASREEAGARNQRLDPLFGYVITGCFRRRHAPHQTKGSLSGLQPGPS